MPEPVPSPLAANHASQGAALSEYRGALVPARYTDPANEHRTVREAAGSFDFSFRAMFAVKGEDRQKFLHRIVSNDIKSLTHGQGPYATLLNPQGHILVDFGVYCAEDQLLVATDTDLRDKAIQGLGRYIIADRVKLEPLDWVALTFQGPRARDALETILQRDLPVLTEHGHFSTEFAGSPLRAIRETSTGEEGYEVWLGPKEAWGVWQAACAQAAAHGMLACGWESLETLRIEAGIPRYGPDFGEDTLPLEAGLLNALSFSKGCYIGQEIVERARSRGHVNWKLTGVVIDAQSPPAPGEKLFREGKETGEITSACVSPTLGKVIALAYLRREVAEPGTKLTLASGTTATAASLPFYPPAQAFRCG
jgi:glycine cleavage system T protein